MKLMGGLVGGMVNKAVSAVTGGSTAKSQSAGEKGSGPIAGILGDVAGVAEKAVKFAVL